jgi:hypothetical protein
MKFVVSIGGDKKYFSFINPLLYFYKNLDIDIEILLLSNHNKTIQKYKKIKEVKFYTPNEQIDIGIQGKLLRHYYPCTLDEQVIAVTDADQFILNPDKLNSHVDGMKNIIAFGKNIFDNTELDGKTPMSPYITTPQLSRRLFNIEKDYTFEKFIDSLLKIDLSIDNNENIKNNFANFSDESLFRLLKKINSVDFQNIDRYLDTDGDRRIDRSAIWNTKNPNIESTFWNQFYLKPKQKKDILNRIYFDLCPPRPNTKILTYQILKTAIKSNQ